MLGQVSCPALSCLRTPNSRWLLTQDTGHISPAELNEEGQGPSKQLLWPSDPAAQAPGDNARQLAGERKGWRGTGKASGDITRAAAGQWPGPSRAWRSALSD